MEYDGREAGIGASAGKEGDMGCSGQIGGGGKRGVFIHTWSNGCAAWMELVLFLAL
jgi:hypothetical protein